MEVEIKDTTMTTQEKADRYYHSDIEKRPHELLYDRVTSAYIQGSKDMYIEKEHEKIYNASEYLPPNASGYRTVEVVDFDSCEMVYYDYYQKAWFTCDGDFTIVEKWKFGEPVKVETEKTAHQLSEELKQLQYEKQQMESQFTKVIETFEELLTDRISTCELRDVWRKRAGLVQKCEE